MRIEGHLKTWNDDRGFGFIEPRHGGPEVFAHIKAFSGRAARPVPGQALSFEVETGPDGRKRATRIALQRPPRSVARQREDHPAQWGTASLFALPAFAVLFAAVAALWRVPGWVAAVYLAASVVCFVVYAWDKAAAAADRRRIPEDTLLGLGLLGGWPGAIVAQQVLRHKSSKASFRAMFWLTVLANVAAFVVLSSPLRTRLFA